jgi:hypothetical protein
MHVPVTRLNPDTAGSDGQVTTMQELAFAERVISIQKTFAEAIKKTLIAHLKLKGLKMHNESCISKILVENNITDTNSPLITDHSKFKAHLDLVENDYFINQKKVLEESKSMHELGMSYWDQYELNEVDIRVKFTLPTSFMALRDQQQFDLKWATFNSMASSGHFSVYLLAKEHLGMTDQEMLKHIEWKKKEAEKNWEISRIEEGGPEFRENTANMMGLGADEGMGMGGGDMGMGGGDMGMGGMGSDLPPMDSGSDEAPSFGDMDEVEGEGGDEAPITEPPPMPEPSN